MPVYQIARWSEVFETAESRKYKALPWISERTSFDSTGWQQGLDDFGPEEWPRVYGAWMVLVRVAATAKLRGRLAGDRGEPFSAKRIARPSGICPKLIDSTIAWAIKVGWLVEVLPGDSPGGLPESRENLTATERNGTEHNRTERNGTEAAPARPGRDDLFLNALTERFKTSPAALGFLPTQVKPLSDEQTPAKPLQCWDSCGWSDSLVKGFSDVSRKCECRDGLFDWYRRQLAAPDPVVSDASAGAAAALLALAEQAAKRPGLKNPVAWWRSQLRADNVTKAVEGIDQKIFGLSLQWIKERLVSQS